MIREATNRSPFEDEPTPPRRIRRPRLDVTKLAANRGRDWRDKIKAENAAAAALELDWPDVLRDGGEMLVCVALQPGQDVDDYQAFCQAVVKQVAAYFGLPARLVNPPLG